ncbi:MAG: c-type cytochrome [Anaerolineae bacterium]|nr:c-type cytochrome [Anaerolineae bacterium]
MKRVQLEIVLGTIFVLLSAFIMIDLGVKEEDRLALSETSQRAEQIEFGAAIYEVNCTACHGSHAQGLPGVAPCLRCEELFTTRLEEVGWDGGLEDYIVSIVTKGVQVSTRPQFIGGGSPAMPTWSEKFGGPLRDDQIRAVAAFITNFESWALNPAAVPTLMAEEVDLSDPVSRGRAVFVSLEVGCNACHAISNVSTGIAQAPALDGIASRAGSRIPGLSAEEYIRESILEPLAFQVEGFDPIMPEIFADLLTPEQLEDLIAFLLSLEE